MKIRALYDYDRQAVSDQNHSINGQKTMTQQQYKQSCDINHILKQHGGNINNVGALYRPPVFGDAHSGLDLVTMENHMVEMKRNFMQIPADIRERFMNDPIKFEQFATNEANRDVLQAMGLLKPKKKPIIPPDTKREELLRKLSVALQLENEDGKTNALQTADSD